MSKTLGKATDLITFSRASNATYMGSDGLIKTATSNEPRVEYDASGNVLGLLVEESRTNLITYSADLSQSSWAKVNCTVATDTTTFIDGSTLAYKVVETTANASHDIRDTYIGTPGASYTHSFYAKAAERTQLVVFVGGPSISVRFDISSGTIPSDPGGNGSIHDVGDGWYRCAVTGTSDGSGNFNAIHILYNGTATTYPGDGTSGLYICGAQLEAGAFPTSYIPTSGATATRAADVASIATSEFGYRADEGTVVVEASFSGSEVAVSTAMRLGVASNTADRILLYRNSSQWNCQIKSGNATQVQLASIDDSANNKLGCAYKANSSALSDLGGVQEDTSCILPDVTPTEIGVGSYDGSNYLNGHIKSIKYYPRRLTNTQLAEVTS